MNPETWNLKLDLRQELRLALLAATETCWVYAVVVLFTALVAQSLPLMPLPFFAAYWLALIVGRALPVSKLNWIMLQTIAVVIAVITVLVVIRAEIYPRLDWQDFTWLPSFAASLLSLTNGIAMAHIVGLGVIYVFVRGLSLAQRPLTLWFVGYQFRIGIVVFFLVLLIAGISRAGIESTSVELSLWIFVYFFLSLLAIALARIEEMESDIRYSPRWVITLLAAVALVLFIGLGVLQVFTLDVVSFLLTWLAPLGSLVSIIILLLAIPFGILLEWLINLLRPLFTNVGAFLGQLQNLMPNNLSATNQVQDAMSALTWLEPILKTAVALLIVFALGTWIARALNRRMRLVEEETFIRESIGDDEYDHARRDEFAKKKVRPRAHHIAAESIRRIYAALITRAADAGLPRHTAETPYEFLPRLEQHWQSQTDDLRAITEAYVDVHYAEHDATPEQVSRARAAWSRVQQSVRRIRK